MSPFGKLRFMLILAPVPRAKSAQTTLSVIKYVFVVNFFATSESAGQTLCPVTLDVVMTAPDDDDEDDDDDDD